MSDESAQLALHSALDELVEAGAALRDRERASIAASLAQAWALIADPERALGRAAREQIPESSGLTLPMVAWALSKTLREIEPTLEELARRMAPPEGTVEAPPRMGSLVLAGNVFTACVQPLCIALLAKAPTFVKASSADDTLPRLFVDALAAVDPELAAAVLVLGVPRGHPTLEAAITSRADVASVFGSDATLTTLRARTSANTTFIGHGHGLGLGWVENGADLDEAASAFALDVAAYDQRGCMSPHTIVTLDRVDATGFARKLARALGELATTLPRGPLPTGIGAAQMQWRGVAVARGELFEGDGWAVSLEENARPRLSPGWRNVMVTCVEDRAAFGEQAGAFGAHLKTVGVAGDAIALARALPPGVSPRVATAGTMQTPSLLAYADGLPPWDGWRRFVSYPTG